MSTKLINGKYFTRLKTKGQVFEFWTSTKEEAFKITSELTGIKY